MRAKALFILSCITFLYCCANFVDLCLYMACGDEFLPFSPATKWLLFLITLLMAYGFAVLGRIAADTALEAQLASDRAYLIDRLRNDYSEVEQKLGEIASDNFHDWYGRTTFIDYFPLDRDLLADVNFVGRIVPDHYLSAKSAIDIYPGYRVLFHKATYLNETDGYFYTIDVADIYSNEFYPY